MMSRNVGQGCQLQFEVEKLVYGGDGLARLPADEKGRGKTVFVPFVVPGEQVEASVVESRPGFTRAKLDKVLTRRPSGSSLTVPILGAAADANTSTSAMRPSCATRRRFCARRCAERRSWSCRARYRVHSGEPWNYRNRTRLRVQHAPTFAIGYHRSNSHELLPVEQCPISSPLINRAIAAVALLGSQGKVPASLHGLQFFADHVDGKLLVEAYVRPGSGAGECQPFAADLHAAAS